MFNFNKYNEIKGFLKKNNNSAEIIAISKNHSKNSVLEAIKHGVFEFGENRVVEARNKFSDLKTLYPEITLHLTGPLQSNKVKDALELFDIIHTLDREKIAKEFFKHSDLIKSKKIFVQVNTGEEDTKSGVSPKDLSPFITFCKKDLKLNIVGLMCIPPIKDDPSKHFTYLSDLANQNQLENLSIGMSNDYKIALNFYPTYIRLGTVLFGNREWKTN